MSPKRRKQQSASNQILKVLLIVLLVLLLIAGGLFLFIQIKLGAINRLLPGQFEGSGVTSIEDWEAVDWGDAGVATSVEGVVNVLLVGQDTRTGERERSDTMIVLSVNKNTNQITMVSLMRDLYVQIPGYQNNKLNAAYQLGGFELLDQTISENFGIVIDYNVEVDFEGFKNIVDTLGGIDVELNEDEAAYLRGEGGNYVNGVVGRYTGGRTYDVQAGVNHLDGSAALDYVRARHVGNSDFERTERQRTVLKIIYNQLKKTNWLKLLKVYDSVAGNISTDMTNNQILSIAFSAYSMSKNEINSYRIPADNMYYNTNLGSGMDVLIPNDWDETRQLLRDYLYSEDGGASAQSDIE